MEDLYSELRQTRESLEFALQSGKMSTWDIDLETNQVTCSKEMLELWNIEFRDFKNQRSVLQSKVHPEDLDRMKSEINQAIKNQTTYEIEYRIIPRPGETKWVLSRGRCTFTPDTGKPARLAGVVFDITERKLKEIELNNAQKARSDFLSIAGHELKTPLTCLQLQLKAMEWQLRDISFEETTPEVISKGVKKQQDHLLRISRIVDNILDETKISEGLLSLQRDDCELTEIVQRMVEEVKILAESNGVEIIYHRPTSIHGNWDSFRLEQVLLNLLINAIRFSNKKPIHVEVTTEKSQALVTVRDEGIGIRPEDHSRVFQRFERVNQNEGLKCMGLGLYISNHIAQAHGGEIRLKSEFGRGSEFTVALPCS